MSKKYHTLIRLIISIIFMVLSFALLTMLGTHLLFEGDVLDILQLSFGINVAVIFMFPVILAIISLIILPGGIKGFRTVLQPRVIFLAVALAIALTFTTQFIPYPRDIPPCCMTGPTRERGLPLTYSVTHKEFGDVSSLASFPSPSHYPGRIALDVVAWSALVLYAYRVKLLVKHRS